MAETSVARTFSRSPSARKTTSGPVESSRSTAHDGKRKGTRKKEEREKRNRGNGEKGSGPDEDQLTRVEEVLAVAVGAFVGSLKGKGQVVPAGGRSFG